MKLSATTKRSNLVNLIGSAVLFAVIMALSAAGIIDRYLQGVLIIICINIILAVSLNLTAGCLGQLALGHAGFMSIGAYAGAIFAIYSPLPGEITLILSMLIGGAVAAVFGLLVGIPVLRLKGDYLAIITLGFGEIIRVIMENLEITGGASGLRGIPNNTNFTTAYWVMVIVIAVHFTLMWSRHGRSIKAICADDIAAEAAGVRTTYYKVFTFTISAFFAGIAGALYSQHIGLLSAKAFDFNRSIEILVLVVLGGLGSFTGSIVAATGLTTLTELLREFSDWRMLVYALALILVMLFKPSGLFGRYEFSLTRLIDRIFKKEKGSKPSRGPEKKLPKKEDAKV